MTEQKKFSTPEKQAPTSPESAKGLVGSNPTPGALTYR